jgi:integrase
MPRTARERIAPNIYRDNLGIAAYAHAVGRRREKRFKADTPLKVIREWQDDTRRALRREGAMRASVSGTFASDVALYLGGLAGTTRRDAANLLAHWTRAVGASRTRTSVTVHDLRAAVSEWQEAGHAASSINHRRRALIALYVTLDGEETPVLPRRLPRVTPPRGTIRAVDIDVIDAILRAMPDRGRRRKGEAATREASKTKARLRLMLWTGLGQASVMRLRPDDIDLETGTLHLRPRQKGRGSAGATVRMLPEGVEACRAWLRAMAWGRFSTDSMAASLAAALRRARADDPALPIPEGFRPYDLRHCYLSYMLENTGDLRAVQELAQHRDIRSTLRYTERAVSPRAGAAIDAVTRIRGIRQGHGDGK